MRSYSRLDATERRVIQKMLYNHVSLNQIAANLGRQCSTISREIARNKTHGYNSHEAEMLARKRQKPRERILGTNGVLRLVITTLMMNKNSPEAISVYYLPLLFPDDTSMRLSPETIYQWVYRGSDHKLVEYLFTRRKKRQNRSNFNKNRGVDITKRNIRERMPEANNRTEYGHLEGDLIVSSGNDSYILTMVDRKAKHLWGLSLPQKDSAIVLRGIVEALEELPSGFVKSLTFDNGSEFALHHDMEKALKCKVFFADPYSSWQRGLSEHTNARIRQYLPKKTSFAGLTDEQLDLIINEINSRPRKSLGWLPPDQVLASIALET